MGVAQRTAVKAAVLREPKVPLAIETVEIDAPGPREIRIDTRAVGLCRSDMHFIDGVYPHPLPTVPGHEAAGVVDAVGSEVTSVVRGDHVVTFLAPFCGACAFCMKGQHTLCRDDAVKRAPANGPRLTLDGEPMVQFLNLSAFAEKILVHENGCVKVSKDIPFDRAALLGCAVVTGAGAIFHESALKPGETVAVVGAGGIGLSAINAAKIAGAGTIIAIDMISQKLDLAKKFGATHGFQSDEDVVAKVVDATGGGVDYAIEAVGRTDTAELCWKILKPGGTATILGMIPPGATMNIHGPDFLQARKIQGSMMGGAHLKIDMPRLVDFYLDGRLDLDNIIAQRMPLARINDAVDTMRDGGDAVRSVIMFE